MGIQPIGIALVNGGKRIVVSDDNNIATPPEAGNLAVIDTAAALAASPRCSATSPPPRRPHEMVLSPDGRFLYVTNYDGSQVQIIKVSTAPLNNRHDSIMRLTCPDSRYTPGRTRRVVRLKYVNRASASCGA